MPRAPRARRARGARRSPDAREAAIVRRELELLERLDLELACTRRASSSPIPGTVVKRSSGETCPRGVEHAEAAGVHDLGDGAARLLPMCGSRSRPSRPSRSKDLGHAGLARAQTCRRRCGRRAPVGIIALRFEQVGDPFEHVGDVLVAGARGGGAGLTPRG